MSLPAFADLLERLVFTPGRNAKLALLKRWLAETADPDRGLGLAALTGDLFFRTAKPALIRELVAARTDATLLALSYDYVGDFAETVALIWPERGGTNAPPPSLAEIVEGLELAARAEVPGLVETWLDASDASARLALIKLVTGGLRVGVSARLARTALADWAGRDVAELEDLWPALSPPYRELFRWLEGAGPKPDARDALVFRPLMLAQPLEPPDLDSLDAAAYRAEWKWDGIRVQLAGNGESARLFSRTGEDISAAFPDVLAGFRAAATLDGELLVKRGEAVAPFADLQQRLNRKLVGPKLLREFPAHVRLYDLLFEGDEDLRGLPFDARRARLEAWFARVAPLRADLSEQLAFAAFDELAARRAGARAASIEGLMLKRADSPYVAGRPKGLWWKWKRAPLSVDAVLMYAQRGHGKRSSYYSDYTFGLWRAADTGERELTPIGKAYSGYTDQELAWLDRWIRNHTIGRFGPVREVEKSLVLEVIFDGAQYSTRHKSGVALRFPRIARLRTDKPAAEADELATLIAMIPAAAAAS
jgi:DNA ligase-1